MNTENKRDCFWEDGKIIHTLCEKCLPAAVCLWAVFVIPK